MFNLIKRLRFKKELKKRREQENHLNEGGCCKCWDDEKTFRFLIEFGPEIYLGMRFPFYKDTCPIDKKPLNDYISRYASLL